MKTIIAATLLTFAVPAFACDHDKAQETTNTSQTQQKKNEKQQKKEQDKQNPPTRS